MTSTLVQRNFDMNSVEQGMELPFQEPQIYLLSIFNLHIHMFWLYGGRAESYNINNKNIW